jgi:hypothetical protein
MADPVSWLLIEPGWRVDASDGTKLGRVEEVTGDSSHDIFDGLSVSSSLLAAPRYVPAEQVGVITDGVVRLTVDAASFGKEAAYDEPAEEVEVSSEKASPLTRFETHEQHPLKRESSPGIVRRALEWLGVSGKR